MRFNRTGEEPLTLAEIDRRILERLDQKPAVSCASQLGQAIWPKNTMRAQGLGLAAAKHIRRLNKAGKVYWSFRSMGGHKYQELVKV